MEETFTVDRPLSTSIQSKVQSLNPKSNLPPIQSPIPQSKVQPPSNPMSNPMSNPSQSKVQPLSIQSPIANLSYLLQSIPSYLMSNLYPIQSTSSLNIILLNNSYPLNQSKIKLNQNQYNVFMV